MGDIDGIGDLAAADILTHTGDRARFHPKAAFAMANDIAPIEAPSVRAQPHRFGSGGNRQIDRTIHAAAIAQIVGAETIGRRYCEHCLTRGKTNRDAIRGLKRRISEHI